MPEARLQRTRESYDGTKMSPHLHDFIAYDAETDCVFCSCGKSVSAVDIHAMFNKHRGGTLGDVFKELDTLR